MGGEPQVRGGRWDGRGLLQGGCMLVGGGGMGGGATG